ncbi:hypothetical protein PVAP13_4KG133100 [Panicum virgatum]|uniref:Uncharacterized protein n=1 Tax=Panicum virgatum TaxID=38727 RepID=A0A8T0THD6_PANVG|nr:hypothetical protein PVAP13_4KG133100 [Panicum virgatum]
MRCHVHLVHIGVNALFPGEDAGLHRVQGPRLVVMLPVYTAKFKASEQLWPMVGENREFCSVLEVWSRPPVAKLCDNAWRIIITTEVIHVSFRKAVCLVCLMRSYAKTHLGFFRTSQEKTL